MTEPLCNKCDRVQSEIQYCPECKQRPAYLIRKYGGYYRPNSQGYTNSAILAGRYTLPDAESITHPNGPKGPRDGMTYIHEDEVKDEDWLAHRDAIAAITPQEAAKVLLAMGPTDRHKAWKATRDAPGMFGTWLHAALRAIASEDSHE